MTGKSACEIHCCGCNKKIAARLTTGQEIYPHRPNLAGLPFWVCDGCHNFVGCHHKTSNRTQPLGCIPTPELKKFRQKIHRVIDPLWRNNMISRKQLYARLSERLGRQYHTASIRSTAEAQSALAAAEQIRDEIREKEND